MSKQDRQGVRTPAQLEEKYKFGESFAKAFGLAEEAQRNAADAKKEADALGVRVESEVIRLDDKISLAVKSSSEAKKTAEDAQGNVITLREEYTSKVEIMDQEIKLSVESSREAKKTAEDAQGYAETLREEYTSKVEIMDQEINLSVEGASEAKKIANEAKGGVETLRTEYKSEVNVLHDQINLSVTNTKTAQSTADEAKQKTQENAATIESKYADLKLQADGMDLTVASLRTDVGKKADQTQVTEIKEHFRFGEDGLTISNSGTGMGINVSEKKVAFTGGKDPTTVITPNAMETTNITVGTRLDVGNFSWIPRTNGNLSLRYTGGNG